MGTSAGEYPTPHLATCLERHTLWAGTKHQNVVIRSGLSCLARLITHQTRLTKLEIKPVLAM